MSEFKISGTIKTILPTETGAAKSSGKEWSKLNFIVSNDEGYEGREQIYCFQIFGQERVDKFLKFNTEGTQVDVKFDIQVNEHSGRYFTNLSAFHVASGERVEQSHQTPALEEEGSDSLPF